MTKINFKVKVTFYSGIGGACVDTRFWHVSRKSVAKEKRFCVVRSMDLEGWSRIAVENLVDRGREIDQIFWLQFGKSYLIFRIVFVP
jgi:hypothetical protein